MPKAPTRFIVIDDDPVNNFLCTIVINEVSAESEVKTFEIPEEGFDYIAYEDLDSEEPTILFLDINMPTLSGWEFLELFNKLDEKIKARFKIYMLSSSIDPGDNERAGKNNNVAGYIEKPLSEDMMLSIVKQEREMD